MPTAGVRRVFITIGIGGGGVTGVDVEHTKAPGGEHETDGHHFSTDDGMHCKHCGGYPFALMHWTLG